MDKKYKYFESVVFRTPLHSFSDTCNNTLLVSKEYNEAIRLASPELYNEKIKEDNLGKYSPKMKQSLYKYLSRGAFRCTPFALFAGCSVGKIGDRTEIKLSEISTNRRETRLDMNVLGLLVQEISKIQHIKEQLRFSPNDSLYELGGAKRYIEYYFIKTRRIHKISSIEPNEYLEDILKSASTGMKYSQLLEVIKDDDIERSEIIDFVDDIISSQLLKNELELSVTGEDQLSKTIKTLESLNGCEDILLKLKTIKNILQQIDSNPIGDTIDQYEKIEDIIKEMGIEYEKKYLFQADMFKPTNNAQVSKAVVENISEGIKFLNRMTPTYQNENIKKFIKDFQERYEGVEMPLLKVLDAELGVGYGDTQSVDQNPLIDNILFQMPANSLRAGDSDNSFKNVLLKKYMDCIKNGDEEVDISDADSKEEKEPSWDDLPLTLTTMCSVLDNDKVFLKSVGGSSAANLLGRFCHIDKGIEGLCKEITQKEQELNPNAIFAEIVHLPESRTGNILFRPVLREYEIQYLSNAGTTTDKTITLSDIIVSIIGGKVVLKSKRLSKVIIPRLSTAHNYSMSSLPVYRFLCDLQTQDIRGGLNTNLFSIYDAFDFCPRVIYKNCILCKKKWRVVEGDFKDVFDKTTDEKKEAIAKYIKEKHIPTCVDIADGDNALFIDFENDIAIEIFLKLLKTRKTIMVEETLFESDKLIIKDNKNKGYTNEFIFAFYKNN